MSSRSLAEHLADKMGDRILLRELVACAAYDITAGHWRLGGPTDPRRIVDGLRVDILEENGPRIEFEELHGFAVLIADAVIGLRLADRSETLGTLKEMLARDPKGSEALNRVMLTGLVYALSNLGTTSPMFEAVKKTIREAQGPIPRDDGPMLSR